MQQFIGCIDSNPCLQVSVILIQAYTESKINYYKFLDISKI